MSAAIENKRVKQALTLRDFWDRRNLSSDLLIERLTSNNLSIGLAFVAHRLGMSANMISVGGGVFGVLTFFAAIVLPVDAPTLSVITIFALCQFTFLLDCADGQLARVTDTASKYGSFLDRSFDIVSTSLQYAAFFAYIHRYFMSMGNIPLAEITLLFGLVFVLGSVARFFTWQLFSLTFPEKYENTKIKENYLTVFLKNIMDHQFFVFSIIIYIVSPVVCLSIFSLQLILRVAVYFRYLRRAYSGR